MDNSIRPLDLAFFDRFRTPARAAVWTSIPMQFLEAFRQLHKGYKVRYRGSRVNRPLLNEHRTQDQRRSNCLKARAEVFSVYVDNT